MRGGRKESVFGGRPSRIWKSAAVSLLALAASGAGGAWAQGAALEEIVVTAERRQMSIQDTPVSVVALSGVQMEEFGVTDLKDLQNFVPGLSVGGFSGGDTEPNWYIRGIGGGDARTKGVGLYVDGVYYASANGSLLDIVDVERVEVLRGPQGTLFGRNTTGGLVQFITVKPQPEFGGHVRATLGSYDRADVSGVVNVPFTDNFFGRFTAAHLGHDGYVTQANDKPKLGDDDTRLARAQFRFMPTNSLTIDVSGTYTDYQDNGAAQIPIKISEGPSPFGTLFESLNPEFPEIASFSDSDCITGDSNECTTPGSDLDQRREGEVAVGNLTVDWGITDDIRMKSITGYIDVQAFQNASDWDGLPIPMWSQQNAVDNEETFSEELQLLGDSFDGLLSWQTGVYYSKLRQDNFSTTVRCCGFSSSGGPTGGANEIRSSNLGVYGDGTVSFTDRLRLSLGGRYTRDKLDHNVLESVDWEKFIWRANLQYDWTDDIMTYASLSTGYRAGGISQLCDDLVAECFDRFGAEEVFNREVGIRSSWLDGGLRVNLTYFNMKWKDRQVATLTVDPESETGVVSTTDNIGKANLDGFELEANVIPVQNLTLSAAGSYLDADITEGGGDGSLRPGDEMPRAPELNFRAGASYRMPLANGGSVMLRGDVAHTDQQRSFPTPFNSDIIPSYTVAQARIQYEAPDGRWSAALFCTNCTDEKYWTSAFDNRGVFQIETAQLGRPREFGVTLRVNY